MRTKVMMLISLLLWAQTAWGGPVRRFVLAVGANHGGEKRAVLRYAVSDAENFSRVLEEMGGLLPENAILLEEPDLETLHGGLDDLREKVVLEGTEEGRTEVLFFYSGHADEKGLLLGEERFPYGVLRRQMDAIPADVRIAVLDACASGAITRFKGGKRQAAFLMDDAADMKGYAFLTSSSEEEAAQESDLIGASFFTHYLISGMRGAADVSGDGKVTLEESYQFALGETLSRTARTQGGVQHPQQDINMTGTGAVVMTDLRQTSAGLLLEEGLEGRFFVHNEDQQLVAELYKPFGRSMELGLEPGTYHVYLEQKQVLFFSTPALDEGQRLTLAREDFGPIDREETVRRGRAPAEKLIPYRSELVGRWRIEAGMGWWNSGMKGEPESRIGGIGVTAGSENLLLDLVFSHWLQEDLAATFNLSILEGKVNSTVAETEVTGVVGMLAGVRYYPLPTSASPVLRPYAGFAAGAYWAEKEISRVASVEAKTMGAFGGKVNGGVDIHLSRRLLLGARAGYNLMTDFSEPIGGRKNFSGVEMSMGVSLLLGRGAGG